MSGCRNATLNNVEPNLSGFSCNFSIKDTDFEGTLEVDDEFKCIFRFESPTDMSGTVITVSEDAVLVDSNGYVSRFDNDTLPEDSFTVNVQNALSVADSSKIINNRDSAYIDGTGNTGDFRIEFLHSGYIQSISFFELDTVIEFTNVINVDTE